MPLQDAVTAVWSVVALLSLWILAGSLLRAYFVDVFREHVFTLRAELFDLAHDGRIAFTDPAYQLLYGTMNGFLRFGERLGFLSLLAATSALNQVDVDAPDGFAVRWARALEGHDSQVQDELKRLLYMLHQRVVRQIFWGTPLALLLLIPLVAVAAFRALPQAIARRALVPAYHQCEEWIRRRVIRTLDAAAYQQQMGVH